MRKSLAGLMVIASICVVSFAHATYLIKLKNGNEYVTNRYWQEGTQVLFDAEGGIFGIEKEFVSKIEKADRVIKLATAAAHEPAEKSQTEAAKIEESEKPATESTPVKERDPADPIVGEFNRLKEKANQVDGLLEAEMRDLLNQITAFRNKLIKDSKLFIEYPREMNEITNLSNVVEAALRARTN